MAGKDHVAVRLDPSTLERLDILREVLSTEWHRATQSDVLRAAILGGIKSLEKEHASHLAELKRERERQGDKSEVPAAERGGPVDKRSKKSRR